MGNEVSNVTLNVLLPCILLFVVGWLIGAAKLIEPTSTKTLNTFALYFPIPCAILIAFLQNQLTGSDWLFMVPLMIHKVVFLLILLIPLAIFKKFTINVYVTMLHHSTYANCITFGNYFLFSYYPDYPMELLCSLASIPDSFITYLWSVFLLEYQKERNRLQTLTGGTVKITASRTCALIPGIILRVFLNPIIWAALLGLIFNYAVLQTVGSVPNWIKRTVQFGANSVLCVCLVTLGFFTYNYPPTHINFSKHKRTIQRKWYESKRKRAQKKGHTESDKEREIQAIMNELRGHQDFHQPQGLPSSELTEKQQKRAASKARDDEWILRKQAIKVRKERLAANTTLAELGQRTAEEEQDSQPATEMVEFRSSDQTITPRTDSSEETQQAMPESSPNDPEIDQNLPLSPNSETINQNLVLDTHPPEKAEPSLLADQQTQQASSPPRQEDESDREPIINVSHPIVSQVDDPTDTQPTPRQNELTLPQPSPSPTDTAPLLPSNQSTMNEPPAESLQPSPTPQNTEEKPSFAPPPVPPKIKLNFLIIISQILLKHLVAPAIMIPIALIFNIENYKRQALVLISALPVANVPFALGKEYQCFEGETAVSQIIQQFLLCLPTFILWVWIARMIFPLS